MVGMFLDAFDRYALMSTGHPVHIAPATPRDEERVRAFYERLCDISTRLRFFSIRRSIPERELQALVSVSTPSHVTMLASIGGELIGIGEYHVGTNPEEAEVAFAVGDDHHAEGVATLLLEDLAVIAASVGLRRLVAQTLPDNGPMRLVFGTAGLGRATHYEGGLVEFTMELDDMSGLLASAAEREAIAIGRSRDVAIAGEGRTTAWCQGAHSVDGPAKTDVWQSFTPLR